MKRGKNTYYATLARHLHSRKTVVLQEKLPEPKQTSYYQHCLSSVAVDKILKFPQDINSYVIIPNFAGHNSNSNKDIPKTIFMQHVIQTLAKEFGKLMSSAKCQLCVNILSFLNFEIRRP